MKTAFLHELQAAHMVKTGLFQPSFLLIWPQWEERLCEYSRIQGLLRLVSVVLLPSLVSFLHSELMMASQLDGIVQFGRQCYIPTYLKLKFHYWSVLWWDCVWYDTSLALTITGFLYQVLILGQEGDKDTSIWQAIVIEYILHSEHCWNSPIYAP